MARAIYKGVIRIGDFSVPVKLYSAVVDQTVRFHLLHDQDMVRLKQRMVNPRTRETVAHDEMRKGYPIERGVLVLIDDDELEALQPKSSRDIEIEQFVPSDALGHQWYDRPYWLGPDGDNAAYFALVQALEPLEMQGIARWSMRKKRYIGAIYVEQGYLALVTLRHAEEIIPTDELESPAGRPLDTKERQLAGQLTEALEAEFVPSDFRDEYRDRVHQLIEAKRRGKKIKTPKVKEKPRQRALAESLRASLQAVK